MKFHQLNELAGLFENSEAKIEAFLSYLATERKVASATQNQAMNALVFLYKQVLNMPLTQRIEGIRSNTVGGTAGLIEIAQPKAPANVCFVNSARFRFLSSPVTGKINFNILAAAFCELTDSLFRSFLP